MNLPDLTFLDYVGIIGSILIAGAYFAVSSKRMNAERPPFQLLNLAGATLILFSLYERPNIGAIIIEILWVGIGIYTLIKFYVNRRKNS